MRQYPYHFSLSFLSTLDVNNLHSPGNCILCSRNGMPRTRSSMLYPLASQIHQYLNQHKPCATDESLAPYTFAMRTTL